MKPEKYIRSSGRLSKAKTPPRPGSVLAPGNVCRVSCGAVAPHEANKDHGEYYTGYT